MRQEHYPRCDQLRWTMWMWSPSPGNINLSGTELLGDVGPCIPSGGSLESRLKFLFHHQLPFLQNPCSEAHIIKYAKIWQSHCHHDLLHTLRLFLMVQEYSCWNIPVSLFPSCFFMVEVLASSNMIWEYNNMIWEIEEDCSCAEYKHNCCSQQCLRIRILKEIFLWILM